MMEVRDKTGKLLGYLPSLHEGKIRRYPMAGGPDVELKLGMYHAWSLVADDVPLDVLRLLPSWSEPTEIEAARDVVEVLGMK